MVKTHQVIWIRYCQCALFYRCRLITSWIMSLCHIKITPNKEIDNSGLIGLSLIKVALTLAEATTALVIGKECTCHLYLYRVNSPLSGLFTYWHETGFSNSRKSSLFDMKLWLLESISYIIGVKTVTFWSACIEIVILYITEFILTLNIIWAWNFDVIKYWNYMYHTDYYCLSCSNFLQYNYWCWKEYQSNQDMLINWIKPDAMSNIEGSAYRSELAQSLYHFALDRKFTDFKITAKNTTIHCHQVVISSNSEYFRHICLSGNREANLEDTILADNGEILTAVIKYMYLGTVQLTAANVENLILAANFIKFDQLKRKCEQFAVADLSVNNLLPYVSLTKKVRLSSLCDACHKLSVEKFQEVIKTEWLPSLSVDEVIAYLKDDNLKVTSEDQVLDALTLWLQNSAQPNIVKEKSVYALLSCVRLRFCSKAKLEAIAKDTMVIEKFRLKISEYLIHGLHGEGEPRKSYRDTQPKEGDTPSTFSVTTPKEPEAEKLYKETVVIVGGQTTGRKPHENVVSLEKTSDAITTRSSICADCQCYSVCSEADCLIVSGGQNCSTNTSVSKVLKFCSTTGKWTDLPDMLEARDLHGSVCLKNKIYFIPHFWVTDDIIPAAAATS